MFFIGQNLNQVHMIYSCLELLIFFWLSQVDIYCLEFISHQVTEILHLNTNSKGKQSWNKRRSIFTCFFHEIKTNIFTCFFNVQNINIKIPYEQSFFLSLMNVFRSSRLHMFFKIGALKYILWITNSFFIEHLQWLPLSYRNVII